MGVGFVVRGKRWQYVLLCDSMCCLRCVLGCRRDDGSEDQNEICNYKNPTRILPLQYSICIHIYILYRKKHKFTVIAVLKIKSKNKSMSNL